MLNGLLQPGWAPNHVVELYNTWRTVIARHSRPGRPAPPLMLLTSTATFNEHLDHEPLIAGPWTWVIDDTVRYGDVQMRLGPQALGSVTVSTMALHN